MNFAIGGQSKTKTFKYLKYILKDMVSELDKTNHSVYKLTYHLVLVVKYRRNVITEPIF